LNKQARSANGHYYSSIQVLRGLAALAVILFHVSEMLIQYSDRSGIFCSLAPLWQQGAAGVDLFFIISGFVMVQSTRTMFQQPGACWKFLRKRLIRIVPLYWFYTSLMLLLVFLPFTLQEHHFSLSYTLKSYFFIPALNPATGLDLPLLSIGWTLFYEMYFYLLFALLLCFSKKIFLPAISLFFSLSVLAGFLLPALSPLLKIMSSPLLLEFILGCLLAAVVDKKTAIITDSSVFRYVPLILLTAALLCLLLLPFVANAADHRLLFWACPALLLTTALVCCEQRNQPVFPALLLAMGNSSYSTYLSHIFVILCISTLLKRKLLPGLWGNDLLAGVTVLLCLLAGLLSFRFLEQQISSFFQGSRSSDSGNN
jgi:peptidoglycan/LPS O-acetylase OafA/YrhL